MATSIFGLTINQSFYNPEVLVNSSLHILFRFLVYWPITSTPFKISIACHFIFGLPLRDIGSDPLHGQPAHAGKCFQVLTKAVGIRE